MMTNDLLAEFFNRTFEKEINEKLLSYSYIVEDKKIINYIVNLINIDIQEFVDYILNNYDVKYIESSDIVQFSSIEDCTINLCKVLMENQDRGFKSEDIGKFLENDEKKRKSVAYYKYGENQAKTGEQFGLVYSLDHTFFLTCIGHVFDWLDEKEQTAILKRLILRNKLIKKFIYKSSNFNIVNYYSEVEGILSKSTADRRKSNVKKIIDFLVSGDEPINVLKLVDFNNLEK